MVSYEHKVKNIYLGSPGGIVHIPSRQEFVDLKSIMDGLSLTTYTDYVVKLHMPLAGSRSLSNASHSYQGNEGRYASSSPSSSSTNSAYSFSLFTSQVIADGISARSLGYSVRCFNDEYVEPDNTWTVVVGNLGSAGIFYNSTLGLISVTNGSDKNITMKDKNEGATVVYNDGNTLSESNCGKFFQRGNYYGFPFTGNVTTSSTQVSTEGYGGSNPYSSSTFITGNTNWSNPSNDYLWTWSSDEYFVIE